MTEVRIPTDQIPADILQRLQAILDGRPLTALVDRGSVVASSCQQHSTPTLPTTCWSSCAVSSTVNPSFMANKTVFTDPPPVSSSWGKRLFPALPSLSASSTPLKYSSYSTGARTVRFEPQSLMTTTSCDEVDGGQTNLFSNCSPNKRKIVDILDDSGIVRVFPESDDSAISESQTLVNPSDSEIIRIFPETDKIKNAVHTSGIVRAVTPTILCSPLKKARSESISAFRDQSSASASKDWNIKSQNESLNQSGYVSGNKVSNLQTCDTTPQRSPNISCHLIGSCDLQNDTSNLVTPKKGVPGLQALNTFSPRLVISSPAQGNEPEALSSKQAMVSCRKSPGLPTPPQTPDDVDPDIEDDDVFTYNLPELEHLGTKGQASQVYRKNTENTLRRGIKNLRHHSDRSYESRFHTRHTVSSLDPSQNISDKNLGDLYKTRKRLSFDDHSSRLSPNPRPHLHSDPTLPNFQRASTSTNSSMSLHVPTARACQSGQQNLLTPSSTHNSFVRLSPSNFTRLSTIESPSQQPDGASFLQPIPIFHQPTSSSIHPQNSPKFQAEGIEPAAHCNTPGQRPRVRLHSDGDCFSDSYFRQASSSETDLPSNMNYHTPQAKRRRTDTQGDGEQRLDANPTNQLQMMWPRDRTSPADGDCACSKIAQNFLQLVEGAYRRVGQITGAQMGFDQFREELALTNNLLRESLVIVQQFRVMCRHEEMPSTEHTPSTSQR